MPTFDTPQPIAVSIDIVVGDITVVATDRADTVVEIMPTDPGSEADVSAAARTTVDFSGGRLVVRQPKTWKHYTLTAGRESIDVRIDVPAGSSLQGDAALAALRCSGPLAECRYKTAAGDITVEQASPARLRTSAGNISADRLSGHSELSTGSGSVWIDAVHGTAAIKNTNGDTWVGAATGDLRLSGANGSISVGRSEATVGAKTSRGDVTLHEIAGGSVVAETSFGRIDLRIPEGVAAWLDLTTGFGHVQNALDSGTQPEPGRSRVEVRARTSYGDITVSRSATGTPVEEQS